MQIRCTVCLKMYEPQEGFSAEDMRCPACRGGVTTEPPAAPPADPITLRDPVGFAAELMLGGKTRFRAKKALLNAGLSEEAAEQAAEAGREMYKKARSRKLLRSRFIGLGVMLLGLTLTATFALMIPGVIIVVFATLTLALAGLVAMIAPDTLENFGDWFGEGPRIDSD